MAIEVTEGTSEEQVLYSINEENWTCAAESLEELIENEDLKPGDRYYEGVSKTYDVRGNNKHLGGHVFDLIGNQIYDDLGSDLTDVMLDGIDREAVEELGELLFKWIEKHSRKVFVVEPIVRIELTEEQYKEAVV